jgi:hypothetical protein
MMTRGKAEKARSKTWLYSGHGSIEDKSTFICFPGLPSMTLVEERILTIK